MGKGESPEKKELRQVYAAVVLHALVTRNQGHSREELVKCAVGYADALLKELGSG